MTKLRSELNVCIICGQELPPNKLIYGPGSGNKCFNCERQIADDHFDDEEPEDDKDDGSHEYF